MRYLEVDLSGNPSMRQQDESDELPELDFGNKELRWRVYGLKKQEQKIKSTLASLAAEEGKTPARVQRKILSLSKAELFYVVAFVSFLQDQEEMRDLFTEEEIAEARDFVDRQIARARAKRKKDTLKTRDAADPTPTPSTPPAARRRRK